MINKYKISKMSQQFPDLELLDPFKSRIVSKQSRPYIHAIPSDLIFSGANINWITLRNFLARQGKITQKDFKYLIKKAKNYFASQPNLLKLEDPLIIVGDIHGQFYDMLTIFNGQQASPQSNKYLFIGDYVDRGRFSCEVIILLLALKISFPATFFMLRGNHQCKTITQDYGFKAECSHKYGIEIYEELLDLFNHLPIACLINKNILSVHGGISHNIQTLSDLDKIDRVQEIPRKGIFCDLLWSDPIETSQGKINGKLDIFNNNRKAGVFFGAELTKKFLNKNKLKSIFRAHQCVPQGYKMYYWYSKSIPMVLTIFSAPNYCDYFKNQASILMMKNKKIDLKQYKENYHPFLLPKNVDIWDYILLQMVKTISNVVQEIVQPGIQQFEKISDKKMKTLANKLKYLKQKSSQSIIVSQDKIKENQAYIGHWKRLAPDDRLFDVMDVKKTSNMTFEEKIKLDLINESFPKQTFHD